MTYNDLQYLNSFIIEFFPLIMSSLFILLLIVTLIFMKSVERKLLKNNNALDSSEKYLKLISSLRELIEITRKDSSEMLRKANEESANLLKENLNFSENMQDLIRKKSEIVKRNYLQELKKSSLRLSQQFQEEYKKEFAKGLFDLKESNSAINKKILEEAESLIQDIHNHLHSNHDLIVKKIDEDMSNTEKFLETYRQNRINEFDTEFNKMLNFYVKDYLKKNLTVEEHEEIIKNIVKDFEKSFK